ncbi:hypothetical protein [Streptomyces sp. AK04-3B]|uniref:hypothetical protein n=1 Tax=unclassified Streptomyces TaxID=2593676 RepID=UPI0029AA01B7|nr:hypothetical protein [Streptomyces sp. AK04-3B]MDX3802071.1 hypothetical protein [Streptomyces sp. AK04-3B]
MRARRVIGRGARLGVLIGAWPAGTLGLLCLVTAFVFLTGGLYATAWALTTAGVYAALGSMAVGVVLGTATGVALAIAPRRLLARAPLRGLLAALTAGLPVAALYVAFLTAEGCTLASYPLSTHFVGWAVILTIALVAAARSGEIAGCGADATTNGASGDAGSAEAEAAAERGAGTAH